MAKRKSKKTGRRSGAAKAPRRAAKPGAAGAYDFDADMRTMRARMAAEKKGGGGGDPGAVGFAPEAPMAEGSTVVPRGSVGAAVQAAIAFENATRVVAEATDGSAANYSVSWT